MRNCWHRWRWVAAILLALLLGAAALLLIPMQRPLNASATPRVFRVECGQSMADVARALVEEGFIARRAPLAVWARLTGADRRIQEGEYELAASLTPREILGRLEAGARLLVSVTIPEGWTQRRILERLAGELSVSLDSLRAAAASPDWFAGLDLPQLSLEGYLHPETYRFERRMPARRVLRALLAAGLRMQTARRLARAESLGWSWHEVLTLASIIEAETARPDERPQIAAVYHKRLARGWLLQADPTVAYALGKPALQLTLDDLEAESPYNTYLVPGFPPGPICSPGEPSIVAALWPEEGFEALYFVARGDGSHVFSRTLADHNRARRGLRP